MEQLVKDEAFAGFLPADETQIQQRLSESLQTFASKVIVLDDDPTGVQTVHGVSVYTDWTEESIEEGFQESGSIFFILTNSRGFSEQETKETHQEIATNILTVSQKLGRDFILISRGDSTLRGHYPLETEVLKDTLEAGSGLKFDGEVLLPFFKEGGRFTLNNIHYVQEGDLLTPAGETEFAKDKTFGYRSSHLGDYIEEKTGGRFKSADGTYITLDSLRSGDVEGIVAQLRTVTDFGKVVVNALDYADVKLFSIALIQALQEGKRFLFRTAAAFTKVIGGVSDKALLTREELIKKDQLAGGLIIIGSHVKKTTEQVEELKSSNVVKFIEFDQHLVLREGELAREVDRVVAITEEELAQGNTVAVYTRRERLDSPSGDKQEDLRLAIMISDAVTSIVQKLKIRPNFLVAKGGITSSDIGTKGLGVRKAIVAGQILPGIPVWLTGSDSKFPELPYIIFPGNVGTKTALKEVVETLSTR